MNGTPWPPMSAGWPSAHNPLRLASCLSAWMRLPPRPSSSSSGSAGMTTSLMNVRSCSRMSRSCGVIPWYGVDLSWTVMVPPTIRFLMRQGIHHDVDAHRIRLGHREQREELLVFPLALPSIGDVGVVRHHHHQPAVVVEDAAAVRRRRLPAAFRRGPAAPPPVLDRGHLRDFRNVVERVEELVI